MPESSVNRDLASIREILPRGTAEAWATIIPAVPECAYLAGGTALAVHLKHRISRDLDFFTEREFDVDQLAAQLSELGSFAPTLLATGTLNGIFDRTKIQFLEASSQRNVEAPAVLAGIRIASVPDLMATKLKVIGDRGALRDYFDIMTIEQQTDISVENGLELFIQRYQPKVPDAAIAHLLRGLGYMDDVVDDPGLPVPRKTIEDYWAARMRTLNPF
ncbi:nucleotidyl transferase AbiEii/AbiGii toxin family protein [Brooklawnia sp.]|uniref:nucleotidyl transferase AbiEii/AbiGii toxin family protein n=1 Tax=Brooklawnia sp. TaxID=2699740 RepID=UPI00311FDCFA